MDVQKRPDPVKYEGILLRILPQEVLEEIQYFEQAVYANVETPTQYVYNTFIVTRNAQYHQDIFRQVAATDLKCVQFSEIESITQLDDAATFFPEEVAIYTRHLRILGKFAYSGGMQDFYTYYEDSQLAYQLEQALMHYKKRMAFPKLFISENSQSKFSLQSGGVLSSLASHRVKEYLECSTGLVPFSVNTNAAFIEEITDVPYIVGEQPSFDVTDRVVVQSLEKEAVAHRMAFLTQKMRIVEELCLIAGHTQIHGVKFLLTHQSFLRQIMEDCVIFSTYFQHYFSVIDDDERQASDVTGFLNNPGSVRVSSGASFQGVTRVFYARDGHPVEELARIDYLCSILTLLWMLMSGTQALGVVRFDFLFGHGDVHLRECLSSMLLLDILLLQPNGLAFQRIDVMRRTKYGQVRQIYEDTVYTNDKAQYSKLEDEICGKMPQKIHEVMCQYSAVVVGLLDMHTHAYKQSKDYKHSPAIFESYLLHTPKFTSDKVTTLMVLVRNFTASQTQKASNGFFLYCALLVLCEALEKSQDARERAAVIWKDLTHASDFTKDTFLRFSEGAEYFHRTSAGLLRRFGRMLKSDSDDI